MDGQKKIQIANFNCTFGNENFPMLYYFEKIIYPAFSKNITRIQKTKNKITNKYFFTNVEIIHTHELGYILKGFIVKETISRGKATVDEKRQIIELDENTDVMYEHTPYSIFGIVLKNHRLFFVKNQGESPDLVSFKATTEHILKEYIKIKNKEIEKLNNPSLFVKNEPNLEYKEYLPNFKLTITPFLNEKSIDDVFNEITTIESAQIKFSPINGDPDFDSILAMLGKQVEETLSEEVRSDFKNPKNKNLIKKLFKGGNGLVGMFLFGKNKSNQSVNFSNDIQSKDEKNLKHAEKLDIDLVKNLKLAEVTKQIIKKVSDSESIVNGREEKLYSEKISFFRSKSEEKKDGK